MRSVLLTVVSLLAFTTECHAHTRLILNPGNTTRQYALLKYSRNMLQLLRRSIISLCFCQRILRWVQSLALATIHSRSHSGLLRHISQEARSSRRHLRRDLQQHLTPVQPLRFHLMVSRPPLALHNPGCTNLTGTTYDQIASEIEGALIPSPVSLGAITGTITPVSVDLNVTLRAKGGPQVNSTTGPLYMGSYLASDSSPCLIHSPDYINQFETQMLSIGGTENGPGWYSFYSLARNLAHDQRQSTQSRAMGF